jgi:hypothetical protein
LGNPEVNFKTLGVSGPVPAFLISSAMVFKNSSDPSSSFSDEALAKGNADLKETQ